MSHGLHYRSVAKEIQASRFEQSPSYEPNEVTLEQRPPPVRFDLNRQALAASVALLAELFDLIETGIPRLASDPLISKVCEHIMRHPGNREPLPEFAQTSGLSYAALRKRFKQCMGLPLNTYRIRARIARAQELLRRHNVKETADTLGYPDAFTFSSQFKRITGKSPKHYRSDLPN